MCVKNPVSIFQSDPVFCTISYLNCFIIERHPTIFLLLNSQLELCQLNYTSLKRYTAIDISTNTKRKLTKKIQKQICAAKNKLE